MIALILLGIQIVQYETQVYLQNKIFHELHKEIWFRPSRADTMVDMFNSKRVWRQI